MTWRSVPGESAALLPTWSCPTWRSRWHQQLPRSNSLSYRWVEAGYAPVFIQFIYIVTVHKNKYGATSGHTSLFIIRPSYFELCAASNEFIQRTNDRFNKSLF